MDKKKIEKLRNSLILNKMPLELIVQTPTYETF